MKARFIQPTQHVTTPIEEDKSFQKLGTPQTGLRPKEKEIERLSANKTFCFGPILAQRRREAHNRLLTVISERYMLICVQYFLLSNFVKTTETDMVPTKWSYIWATLEI